MDDNNLIIDVLVRYSLGERLNETETASLEDWCARSEDHRIELEKFQNKEWVEEQRRQLHSAPTERMWTRIEGYIRQNGAVDVLPAWFVWKYAGRRRKALVAAGTLVLAVIVWRCWPGAPKMGSAAAAALRLPEMVRAAAPLPAGFNAGYERADGSAVLLDTLTAGRRVATENGYWLRKLDSQNYLWESAVPGDVALPAIKFRTGEKGLAVLHLPDKSQITLNKNSYVRSCADSGTSERRIEMSGEASFLIAGNPAKPFIVRFGEDVSAEVLGTKFDARAYKGESESWVTVISGAVRVHNGNHSALLKKNQQARMDEQGLALSRLADASVMLAWTLRSARRGTVEIADADLKSVLRTVASLYGVQIANPRNIRGYAITGTLSRSETLGNTLESIEKLQWHTVKLEQRGDTVVVVPLGAKRKKNY